MTQLETFSLTLPSELHHCNREKENKKLCVLPALNPHQFVSFNYFLLALQWVKDTSMLQHLGFMLCFLKRKSKWKEVLTLHKKHGISQQT